MTADVYRLVIALSYASQQMPLSVSGRLTVDALNAYVHHIEPNTAGPTLEVARPVAVSRRVDALNWQDGDRLAVFMRPPRTVDPPMPLRSGDVQLTLSNGGVRVTSGRKRQLLAGVPDERGGRLPDVDLRYTVSPEDMDALSPTVLRLTYNPRQRTWQAQSAGRNPVLLDEYILKGDPVAVNHGQRLRIYAANATPTASEPLATLAITLERVETDVNPITLEAGNHTARLTIGTEIPPYMLRASGNLTLTDVLDTLLRHQQDTPLPDDAGVYRLRLAAPSVRLAALDLQPDEFLYAPLQTRPAQSTLTLQDVGPGSYTYRLLAGQQTTEKSVGMRLQPGERVPALDVDLYDVFTANGYPPHAVGGRSPRLMTASYRPEAGVWWAALNERAQLPVFVNMQRLTPSPVALSEGDVITVGPSTADYYARFVVKINHS